MKLKIDNNTRTKEIKEAFTKSFPGLKIEFVRNVHGSGEGSAPDDIIKGDHSAATLGGFETEAELNLSKTSTVAEVESSFHNLLGLNVQVFRRSGMVWIETVNTDKWTLEMQMDISHV